jgi:hypothetical protein
MASLRKRHASADADAASSAAHPAIAVEPPVNNAESPLPPPLGAAASSEPPRDAGLTAQLEALRQAGQAQQQQTAAFAIATARRNEWYAGNPLAQKFVAHLNALHSEAIQQGLADTSPEYFQHLDARLAAMQEQQDDTAGQEIVDEMERLAAANGAPRPEPRRPPPSHPPSPPPSIVSAPVSRATPTMSGSRYGRVTLSPEQREAARIAGITEAEYARWLPELERAKAEGRYNTGGN